MEANFSTEELPNYGVPWVITGCLSRRHHKKYAKMRTMSADIIVAPVSSIISIYRPRFWELFLSLLSNGLRIFPHLSSRSHSMRVRIPGSTHVAQDSWKAELFDRALLRRTALVASGENPEVFGYQSFKRPVQGPCDAFLAFGSFISSRHGRPCHTLSENRDQN